MGPASVFPTLGLPGQWRERSRFRGALRANPRPARLGGSAPTSEEAAQIETAVRGPRGSGGEQPGAL